MALFSNNPQYGAEQHKDRLWFSNLVKAFGPPESQPAEIFDLDTYLPTQGVARGNAEVLGLNYIAIPRGRIVGVLPRGFTQTGRPILSIADGKDVAPIGFAFEDVFSWYPQRTNQPPRWRKAGYIELPYISAINDIHDPSNPLKEGDYVSSFYGSITSTTNIAYEDRGKPVKWVEKRLYQQNNASSASVILTNATLPGVTPIVVLAFNGQTMVSGTPTLAWSNAAGKWVATFATAVSTVIYEYGQSIKHKAAQVLAVQQVSSTNEYDSFLKWVEMDFSSSPFGPMFFDYPTSTVTDEIPGGSAGGPYTLAHGGIAPHLKITVTIVTGALVSLDGTTVTALANTDLSIRNGTSFENWAVGDYYSIDFVRGILNISENITNPDGTPLSPSNIRVDYKWASSYERGRTTLTGYGIGLRGMTDGRFTGVPGTPVHLERAAADRRFVGTAGLFGAMRLLFS